jgi:copper homeostasis protein (lipoprotein)
MDPPRGDRCRHRAWVVVDVRDLASGRAAKVPASAPGLALPASFVGILPCADCAGIAQTLSLREDGLYRMRRTYLGKPGNPFAETGRWQVDASGRLLLRSGVRAEPV